jgi:hypothetical protein
VVADAVTCEPVSAAIFPSTGKNTGNFAISGYSAAGKAQKLTAAQAFFSISRSSFCRENYFKKQRNQDRASAWICALQRPGSVQSFAGGPKNAL